MVPEMTYKVSSGTLNLCSLTRYYRRQKTAKGAKYMNENRQKLRRKKGTLVGSQKIVSDGDHLLGSVGIPETHPFCLD